MSCPNYHPTHQNQLGPDGGKYGSTNCTACSAGMAGQAHTCGGLRYTGAQIRAASSEPIPDPRSPGLNLAQVDSALYRLSSGRIDLDTHYRYDFSALQRRVDGGAQAILQIRRKVLVDRGHAHGNLFGLGHAIEIGRDSTGLWFDDPLTGRFYVDWETLKRAAGALVLNLAGDICGYGKAYVAFTRDIVPDYRVSIHPGLAFRYILRDGMIWDREPIRFKSNTGAPCGAPRRWLAHPKGKLPSLGSKRGSLITAGYLKGQMLVEKLPVVDIVEGLT